MSELGPFPDVEQALCNVIEALAEVAAAGTVTPPNLADQLVFVRVVRFGGGSDLLTDSPVVDVDVFAATRAAGLPAAERIRQVLTAGLIHDPATGATLDRVTVVSGPAERPWSDDLRRFGATYRVGVRR